MLMASVKSKLIDGGKRQEEERKGGKYKGRTCCYAEWYVASGMRGKCGGEWCCYAEWKGSLLCYAEVHEQGKVKLVVSSTGCCCRSHV